MKQHRQNIKRKACSGHWCCCHALWLLSHLTFVECINVLWAIHPSSDMPFVGWHQTRRLIVSITASISICKSRPTSYFRPNDGYSYYTWRHIAPEAGLFISQCTRNSNHELSEKQKPFVRYQISQFIAGILHCTTIQILVPGFATFLQ